MAVKQAAAAAKKDVKEAPVPLEVDDRRLRRPKRPTRASIEKKPTAVVMMAWSPTLYGDGLNDVADRDFQHVSDTRTHDIDGKPMTEADIYFLAQDLYSAEDVAKYGDLWHATIKVTNTNPDHLEFGRVELRGGSVKWRVAMRKALIENPTIIFSQTIHERIEEEAQAVQPKRKRAAAAPGKPDGKPVRRPARRIAKGPAVSEPEAAPAPRRRKRAAAAPRKEG